MDEEMKQENAYRERLIAAYHDVRNKTEDICRPLLVEDYGIQSIADVSPPKWHLAHTTWFFETFVLVPYLKSYRVFNSSFQYLFNSYYHGVGKQFPREDRGLLARPAVAIVYDYRLRVNEAVRYLLGHCSLPEFDKLSPIIELGMHHEQQHQELLLMDIKHNFSIHPSFPSYKENSNRNADQQSLSSLVFNEVAGGIVSIGYEGNNFCFDIELPRHSFYLKPYAIANRLITNGEYCEFILAGGYENPDYWLADGWNERVKNQWQSPLYWHYIENEWYVFTLSGLKKLNLNEPVVHVSYYEADAFARWQQKRLPLEAEWEHYVAKNSFLATTGNLLDQSHFHPVATTIATEQFFGDVWEWTATPYRPYPGFQPLSGVLGEYNGKFMSNQMVLRGGCCVTPNNHIRSSYRNYFQPEKRWQFSGIRLAHDIR